MARIEAVAVNQNSSPYTELLLRSLHYCNPGVEGLRVTVMDNHSTDDMTRLRRYAGDTGVEIRLSLEEYLANGNSHGEILRDFVLEHTEAEFYLFLDTDIAFLEVDTIATMEQELSRAADAFGVQALLSHNGVDEQPVGSDYCCRDTIWMSWITGPDREAVKMGTPTNVFPMFYRMTPRTHPCCSLVRNSEQFRLVAEIIGFSCAHTLEAAGGKGFDTFALMTQVMRTHKLRHIYGNKMVLHFQGVCCNRSTPAKEQLRDRMLRELRDLAARGRGAVLREDARP